MRALLHSEHEIAAVITRPPAPTGRGRSARPSPVELLARDAGIGVLTPSTARDQDFRDQLIALAPDAAAVVAYGALLPPAVLAIPKHGWINLHFSILPAWRGAAPVYAAIRHGDEITGATTFRLEAGMDTGPVYGVVTEEIRRTDTTSDLLKRLAESGAALLVTTLDGIGRGALAPVPQPASGVSHAGKVSVNDAQVNWASPAIALDRLIRALTTNPGAWTTFRGKRLGLAPVEHAGAEVALLPGQLLIDRKQVLVGTGTSPVRLGMVQPPGKRPMPAADWARGVRPGVGEGLGE